MRTYLSRVCRPQRAFSCVPLSLTVIIFSTRLSSFLSLFLSFCVRSQLLQISIRTETSRCLHLVLKMLLQTTSKCLMWLLPPIPRHKCPKHQFLQHLLRICQLPRRLLSSHWPCHQAHHQPWKRLRLRLRSYHLHETHLPMNSLQYLHHKIHYCRNMTPLYVLQSHRRIRRIRVTVQRLMVCTNCLCHHGYGKWLLYSFPSASWSP